MEIEKKSPLKGMKFPPQADAATGRFLVSEGALSIKESIYLILMTQKTERVSNPQFGSRTMSYTFADTSPTMLHMMEQRLEEDIISQEPRITEVSVQVEKKDSSEYLHIYIHYRIEDSETAVSQAFMFSLDGGKVEQYGQ